LRKRGLIILVYLIKDLRMKGGKETLNGGDKIIKKGDKIIKKGIR
jgi:hypothetical protein